MNVIVIPSTPSTNAWLAENADSLEAPCMARAIEQTAGRGQRGNSWESQPGMNLTASVLLHPEGVEPRCQFVISEAVALAVVDMLAAYGVEAKVKWPNDIYVADRKICGILIEHSILGSAITRTIAGIGVNINQTLFVSDAPNPVSLAMLTGRHTSIAEAAARLGDALERRMAMTASPERLHEEFLARLWRGDGALYPFFDKLRGMEMQARIAGIDPDGMLTLADADGNTRRYAFKEVEFLIKTDR